MKGVDFTMRYYGQSHTSAKLIVILLLVLVIIGVLKGTDIIVSAIGAILGAIMPCVITIGGLYILIKVLFR